MEKLKQKKNVEQYATEYVKARIRRCPLETKLFFVVELQWLHGPSKSFPVLHQIL